MTPRQSRALENLAALGFTGKWWNARLYIFCGKPYVHVDFEDPGAMRGGGFYGHFPNRGYDLQAWAAVLAASDLRSAERFVAECETTHLEYAYEFADAVEAGLVRSAEGQGSP